MTSSEQNCRRKCSCYGVDVQLEIFQTILDSYEQLGVNVGDTRRNSQGLSIFNAVQADFILEETIKELEEQRLFGLQRDGSHDKACQIWGDTMASKH